MDWWIHDRKIETVWSPQRQKEALREGRVAIRGGWLPLGSTGLYPLPPPRVASAVGSLSCAALEVGNGWYFLHEELVASKNGKALAKSTLHPHCPSIVLA
jgi:hypothetical protein